jgi:hypothetical protein
MGLVRRHPIAVIFLVAVALAAIYAMVTPRPFCKTDLDLKYRVHSSTWVIRELIYHCSALDGQFEISAVDAGIHKTVPLFLSKVMRLHRLLSMTRAFSC